MKYLLTGQISDRLQFRPLEDGDFDWWLTFWEDAEARKFFYHPDLHTPQDYCKAWFQKIYHRYEHDLGGMNVLVNRTSGQPVGQCGLLIQEVDDQREMEIGYSLHPDCWGQGYATEAAQKCKAIAFEQQWTPSLISIIHVDNLASQKVALRNGMQVEKETTFNNWPVKIFRIQAV